MTSPVIAVVAPEHTDCHGGHCHYVYIFDRHHIVHQAEGGKSEPDNLVTICPNEHRNQHQLDDAYDRYDGKVPQSLLRGFGRGVRRRARLRWERLHPPQEKAA